MDIFCFLSLQQHFLMLWQSEVELFRQVAALVSQLGFWPLATFGKRPQMRRGRVGNLEPGLGPAVPVCHSAQLSHFLGRLKAENLSLHAKRR